MMDDFSPHMLPQHIRNAMRELGSNIPRLRSADMVMRDRPGEYLLKGAIPRRGVIAIYGPSQSGKSFLGTDIGFHAASGTSLYFGMRMQTAPIVYVGLEGQHGIPQRMLAWQKHNHIELGERVQVFTDPFRLDDPRAVDELASEALTWCGDGCVTIIDTLAQAMAGFDENNSSEMGSAIAGAQRLAAETRGLVILIHHTGKDVSKGLRGHSSLFGALDAAIEVKARSGARSWKVVKSKDGETGQEFGFELATYSVGIDADGDAVTSCAVSHTLLSPTIGLAEPTGKHQIAILAKVAALKAAGTQSLPLDKLIAAVSPDLDCAQKRRAAVAKDTINRLALSGHLRRENDEIHFPL